MLGQRVLVKDRVVTQEVAATDLVRAWSGSAVVNSPYAMRWPSMLVRNPDGINLKGCSIIYAPAGRAGEYSALACNPYRGCGPALRPAS